MGGAQKNYEHEHRQFPKSAEIFVNRAPPIFSLIITFETTIGNASAMPVFTVNPIEIIGNASAIPATRGRPRLPRSILVFIIV